MKFLRNIDIKKAVSWAGTLLMLVSLGFIVQRFIIVGGDLDFTVFSDPVTLFALLLVALLEGFGIILASINYRTLVANVSGIVVRPPLALSVYTLSNLYKYIPGGVMYVLWRNQLAVENKKLSHGKVALSTIIEGVFVAIGAILVAVVFSFEHSLYFIRQLEILPTVGLVALIVLAVAVPIVYNNRFRLRRMLAKIRKDTNDFRWAVMARRLLFAIILMTLLAFTFLATLMLLGQPMTLRLGITVMGLYMLSWLAGFLTPGAPSGLGVREMVMLMFMTGILNEGILLSAMVIHRLLTALGDVSAYGAAVAYTRTEKSAERTA